MEKAIKPTHDGQEWKEDGGTIVVTGVINYDGIEYEYAFDFWEAPKERYKHGFWFTDCYFADDRRIIGVRYRRADTDGPFGWEMNPNYDYMATKEDEAVLEKVGKVADQWVLDNFPKDTEIEALRDELCVHLKNSGKTEEEALGYSASLPIGQVLSLIESYETISELA